MLESSYSKVFHIYNNNEVNFIDLVNQLKPQDKKIEEVSDDEFYSYVKNKSDIYGIINDITSNQAQYNSNIEMNNNFTIDYMKKDGLAWPEINENYIHKFFGKYLKEGE